MVVSVLNGAMTDTLAPRLDAKRPAPSGGLDPVGDDGIAELEFASSVIADLAAVNRGRASWRLLPATGLVGPSGVTIPVPDLRRIFDHITLRGELRNGRLDRLGRLDEASSSSDASRPWIDELVAERLGPRVPGESPGAGGEAQPRFKVLFSHDVDRTTGWEPMGLVRSILRSAGVRPEGALPLGAALSRKGLVRNAERLFAYEAENGIRSHVFMLAGPFGLGRYASRTSPSWTTWRQILAAAKSTGMRVGLHASYVARDIGSYGDEKRRIEDAAGTEVTCQRNHYLRYDPNRHWSQLEQAGIQYDFSIGFVNRMGFRTGTAQTHRTYDLRAGRESSVRTVPMVFMDTCLGVEDDSRVLGRLRESLCGVRAAGGCVCLNFHPETFLTRASTWEFFRETVGMCRELGADLGGELPAKACERRLDASGRAGVQ